MEDPIPRNADLCFLVFKRLRFAFSIAQTNVYYQSMKLSNAKPKRCSKAIKMLNSSKYALEMVRTAEKICAKQMEFSLANMCRDLI